MYDIKERRSNLMLQWLTGGIHGKKSSTCCNVVKTKIEQCCAAHIERCCAATHCLKLSTMMNNDKSNEILGKDL